MRLDALVRDVEVLERRGHLAIGVSAVTHDSREVGRGALFCCVRGAHTDGHDHAARAVQEGAVALLCERLLPLDVPQIRVAATRPAMARVAAAFHGHPSRSLTVVGVTGTNGKTTTTHLLASVFEANGWPTDVVGTLGGRHTTPEAPELQATLAASVERGTKAVAMEVSSHGLAFHRVDGVGFAAVAFTNLSQDHLDEHGDMEAYFGAKARLFSPAFAGVGVVNTDDPYGRRLLEARPIRLVGYAASDAADVRISVGGSEFTWRGQRVRLRLGGRFNIANALCAATLAAEIGVGEETVAEGLAALPGVPGRFELVDGGQPFAVVVDYAHTPDGLEHVLRAAREVAAPSGKVIAVFGCGGDRDRAKRPLMGAVSTRLADRAILTSDNPRSEDPLAIIDQVRKGAQAASGLAIEPDRRAAIELALTMASPGDVVVIAGKGHETEQVQAGRAVPFDDRAVALAALRSQT